MPSKIEATSGSGKRRVHRMLLSSDLVPKRLAPVRFLEPTIFRAAVRPCKVVHMPVPEAQADAPARRAADAPTSDVDAPVHDLDPPGAEGDAPARETDAVRPVTSSVAGLGVDLVEIERMRIAIARHPRMKERIFSAEERAYCDERNKPHIHYAMRFAAKEAVLKALGTGFSGMRFTDVEVVREADGRPVPRLSGRAGEHAAEIGVVEMHLSLSFTHTTAVASAVALTADARPKSKPEPHDPRAELLASFKDARAILDDIPSEHSGAEE